MAAGGMEEAGAPGGLAAAHVADLVQRFSDVWAAPTSPGDFLRLFTPDVRLEAPFFEPSVGVERAYEEFARFFWLHRDVHGEIHRWRGSGDVVFVEWTLRARVGRRRLVIPTVDRITIRDGLIAERIAYTDGLPIMATIARSPSTWLRTWRAGLAPTPGVRRLMRASTSSRRFRRPAAEAHHTGSTDGRSSHGPTEE